MCKQQLAHVVIQRLFSCTRRKRNVFERQSGPVTRPGIRCDESTQTGACGQNRMPRLTRQRIAVAGGTGRRIACAAAGQYHTWRRIYDARFITHTAYCALIQQKFLHAHVRTQRHIGTQCGAAQRIHDIKRAIRLRKDAIAPLYLQRHAQHFKKRHDGLRIQRAIGRI